MSNRVNRGVTILGAGFSGMAAAQRVEQLGGRSEVFESREYLGGHASTMHVDGFTFDEGPHLSFSKIPEVIDLFAKAVDGDFHEFASIVKSYYQGYWVSHPAQVNLHGLPPDLITRCVVDIVKATTNENKPPITNYAEWLLAQFGETFSYEFPYRYTRKSWGLEPAELSTDWIGPRMYMPKLEEVIRGAVGVRPGNKHYITEFRYPAQGGFVSYAKGLASNATIHLGTPVAWIDCQAKKLGTRQGNTFDYETLISSLALPVLIGLIKDVPASVRDATAKLRCTSLYLVDVGVQRNEGFPDADWLYFYDEDVSFARVSFPHRFAPSNVPPGHGSIQAEIYFLPSKPPDYTDVLSRGIEDMLKTGLLFKDDKIVYSRARTIPTGNVVFDHQRKASLAVVESYLDSVGIRRCGRYGLWGYHWTDESIVSGWNAAEQAFAT